MSRRTRTASNRRGFTMVELVLGLGLLTILVGAGGMIVTTAERAYGEASANVHLDSSLRRAADRLVDEIEMISTERAFSGPADKEGTTYFYFQKVERIVDGEVVWSPVSALHLQYDDGEVDDGKDNDGDGLVDECKLLLTRNLKTSNETRVVLSHNVREYFEGEWQNGKDDNEDGVIDERGLTFVEAEGVLTVGLTLEAAGKEGEPSCKTVEIPFRLRN